MRINIYSVISIPFKVESVHSSFNVVCVYTLLILLCTVIRMILVNFYYQLISINRLISKKINVNDRQLLFHDMV